jgi:hypothetical protein
MNSFAQAPGIRFSRDISKLVSCYGQIPQTTFCRFAGEQK